MIEVPQQDQKVTWRASLLYHPAEEDIEQSFSRVKTHSEVIEVLGHGNHSCSPHASGFALLPPWMDAQAILSLWE
jgi:hypothetical protein